MAFSVFLFSLFTNCLYSPEPGGFALVCGSGRGGGLFVPGFADCFPFFFKQRAGLGIIVFFFQRRKTDASAIEISCQCNRNCIGMKFGLHWHEIRREGRRFCKVLLASCLCYRGATGSRINTYCIL